LASHHKKAHRQVRILNPPSREQKQNVATNFDHNVSVSYIIDLFGKLTRTEQAAWADLLSVEANYETLIHIVISEVVRLRVRIATLQRNLTIAHENKKNWPRTDIIEVLKGSLQRWRLNVEKILPGRNLLLPKVKHGTCA